VTSFDPERIPAAAPAVSVIIAVYNDADNLPIAIESVLNQSLFNVEVIVVDDCSTDSSPEVARRFGAAESRVKVYSTDANSGGAGAPRNIGLANARGEFVMFLDSDDELERHACFNLLRTAKRTGVSLVMGQTKRRHLKDGRVAGWHARLYSTRRVVESIEDDPDLAIDTNSVAKLYRRQWLDEHGLKFPEDIHYEDMVFTALVFSKIGAIAVIPEIVYWWHIYPETVRKSITHQRDDTRSLDFRVEALRRIFGALGTSERPNLEARLQLKVLRHDARVYLNDIADGAREAHARALLERLAPLVATVSEQAFAKIDLAERLAMAAVLVQRTDLVREAMFMARGKADMVGAVSEVAPGVAVWHQEVFEGTQHHDLALSLATFDGAEIADVPWPVWRPQPFVTRVSRVAGGRLRVTGEIQDPWGHYRNLENASWRLRLFERAGLRRTFAYPVTVDSRPDQPVVTWHADIELNFVADPNNLQRLSVRIDVESGSVIKTNAVQIHKVAAKKLRRPVQQFASRLGGVRYEPYVTVEKTLALRPSPVGRQRRRLRSLLKPFFWAAMLPARFRNEEIADTDSRVFRNAMRIAQLAPLRNRVLVEAHMGRSSFDSPGAIGRELEKMTPSIDVQWSAARGSAWAAGMENVAVRHTWKYAFALATSKFVVDNQTLPGYFKKRKRQTYVQTWHGIPLKRMGFDEPRFQRADESARQDLRRKVSYWDYLSCPSKYFAEVFVPAYGVKATLLPQGTPRNDKLVAGRGDRAAAKSRLGLSPDRKIVLYAPTFRDGNRGKVEVNLDLDEWVEAMSDDVQLVVRSHYLNRIRVPRHLRRHIVDLSEVGDAADVMLAADVLVTDYSSIMFDYVQLDRPVVIYGYDVDAYSSSIRGTYFDIEAEAPGQFVRTQSELMDALTGDYESDEFTERRRAFRQKFAGIEPGNATRSTIAEVWNV
jgi:CDP-glycerol glycerophosphotransferase